MDKNQNYSEISVFVKVFRVSRNYYWKECSIIKVFDDRMKSRCTIWLKVCEMSQKRGGVAFLKKRSSTPEKIENM